MPFTAVELNRRYRARKRGEDVTPAPDRRVKVEPGQRFGRLVVAREIPPAQGRGRLVECVCDCGITTTTRPSRLTGGRAKSCGCLKREIISPPSHGLSRHPLYGIWSAMLQRCEDSGCKSYPRYGGRGIAVCAEWHDVVAFIAWIEANLGQRQEGLTLDRIDNDGNYEPGNVRWATRSQQQRNRDQANLVASRTRSRP